MIKMNNTCKPPRTWVCVCENCKREIGCFNLKPDENWETNRFPEGVYMYDTHALYKRLSDKLPNGVCDVCGESDFKLTRRTLTNAEIVTALMVLYQSYVDAGRVKKLLHQMLTYLEPLKIDKDLLFSMIESIESIEKILQKAYVRVQHSDSMNSETEISF
jgi:hypothetical protein